MSPLRPYPKTGKPVKKKKSMRKVRAGGKRRNDKAVVDERYLQFVRDRPCSVPGCGIVGGCDPHHIIARGWAEAKRNDYVCVPLCRVHHTAAESKSVADFNAKYKTDLWRENAYVIDLYELRYGVVIPEEHLRYRDHVAPELWPTRKVKVVE